MDFRKQEKRLFHQFPNLRTSFNGPKSVTLLQHPTSDLHPRLEEQFMDDLFSGSCAFFVRFASAAGLYW